MSKVELKTGTSLEFSPGDIVLIVGPNNSGKSTFLRDIKQRLADSEAPSVVFESVSFSGSSESELRNRIEKYFKVIKETHIEWVPNERGSTDFNIGRLTGGPSNLSIGRASDAFISLLNSEGRLSLSKDVATIDLVTSLPKHPYHVFMLFPEKLRAFSKKIEEAFGLEFTITRIGNPIRGYVGRGFDKSDSISADQSAPKIGRLLQHQGDGLRSYVGIIAEIQTMSHPIILVDEPEAFLHPPQARRLGRTIVYDLEKTRQAFVATHSTHILQGFLARQDNRIKVIRLDNQKSGRNITKLDNHQLRRAVDHPSIANSNLLDSLFFEQTVVCEGDADCKLFEWIKRGDADADGRDYFWFSAGGKHQFPKVIEMLQSFQVDWRAILDLDVLVDWNILSQLANYKSLNISSFKPRISHALKSISPSDLKHIRRTALISLSADIGDEEALREVTKILEQKKSTSPLKQYGLQAIPNGQPRQHVEELLNALENVGICLLRRGEIESYIPSVGNHGPSWVSSVLENAPKYVSELELLRADISRALS